MENAFFLKISFEFPLNLEKSETIENVLKNKVKIRPILYWS